jgi:hypothetical protein
MPQRPILREQRHERWTAALDHLHQGAEREARAGGDRLRLPFRGADRLLQRLVVRPGRPFQLGITIRNNGRFPVRVVGVPYESNLPLSARLLMSGPQKEPGMEERWKAFHPFDLKPGEIRWLVFRGVWACRGLSPGGIVTVFEFPVRFDFLWRTPTARIPIEPLALDGKACPATP